MGIRGQMASIVASVILVSTATPALAQRGAPLPGLNDRNQANRSDQLASSAGSLTMPPDRDTPQSIKAYGLMMLYGRCVADQAGDKLRTAFAQRANSPTERRMFELVGTVGQSCSGSGQSAIPSLTRGVYAEGLYRREMPEGPSYGPLRTSDPGYAKFMAREADRIQYLDKNDRIMSTATSCMVAQQPMVVDAVIEQRHGSADEAKMMDALFALAPSCAGPKRQAKLSRSFLRAFLADSAFRYAAFRRPAIAARAN